MSIDNKILIIWDRIGDYHAARIKALSLKLGSENVFSADLGSGDSLYQWQNQQFNNQHFILSAKSVEKLDIIHRTRYFFKILKFNKIDTFCISGYGHFEYIIFLIISRLLGLRIIIFAESWYGNNKLFNKVKSCFLRVINPFFFVSGIRAYNHFCNNLNINANRIEKGYSVVDNYYFSIKINLNNYQSKTLLCIARFSPEKNLLSLLDCFQNSTICSTWKLILVGDGPLKDQIENKVKKNDNINICGWASYENLPQIYHNASCFILASTFEPWGLVVNEAMAAGLPIIASKECGCVPDLVDDSNGFVFDPKNSDELIETLNMLAKLDSQQLQILGMHSVERIKDYSPESWANRITEFLDR